MFMPSLVVICSLVSEKIADKQTNKLMSNFSMTVTPIFLKFKYVVNKKQGVDRFLSCKIRLIIFGIAFFLGYGIDFLF